MKISCYILMVLWLCLTWSCTKERGYERELVGAWSVSKYEVIIDSANRTDIPTIAGNKVELNFNSNNGFILFFEHLDSSGVVVDTLIGTSTPFIANEFSILVMTTHQYQKSLAARFIAEEPLPNEKFNTESYSILYLNKDSLSLSGLLEGSRTVNSILLQAVRK